MGHANLRRDEDEEEDRKRKKHKKKGPKDKKEKKDKKPKDLYGRMKYRREAIKRSAKEMRRAPQLQFMFRPGDPLARTDTFRLEVDGSNYTSPVDQRIISTYVEARRQHTDLQKAKNTALAHGEAFDRASETRLEEATAREKEAWDRLNHDSQMEIKLREADLLERANQRSARYRQMERERTEANRAAREAREEYEHSAKIEWLARDTREATDFVREAERAIARENAWGAHAQERADRYTTAQFAMGNLQDLAEQRGHAIPVTMMIPPNHRDAMGVQAPQYEGYFSEIGGNGWIEPGSRRNMGMPFSSTYWHRAIDPERARAPFGGHSGPHISTTEELGRQDPDKPPESRELKPPSRPVSPDSDSDGGSGPGSGPPSPPRGPPPSGAPGAKEIPLANGITMTVNPPPPRYRGWNTDPIPGLPRTGHIQAPGPEAPARGPDPKVPKVPPMPPKPAYRTDYDPASYERFMHPFSYGTGFRRPDMLAPPPAPEEIVPVIHFDPFPDPRTRQFTGGQQAGAMEDRVAGGLYWDRWTHRAVSPDNRTPLFAHEEVRTGYPPPWLPPRPQPSEPVYDAQGQEVFTPIAEPIIVPFSSGVAETQSPWIPKDGAPVTHELKPGQPWQDSHHRAGSTGARAHAQSEERQFHWLGPDRGNVVRPPNELRGAGYDRPLAEQLRSGQGPPKKKKRGPVPMVTNKNWEDMTHEERRTFKREWAAWRPPGGGRNEMYPEWKPWARHYEKDTPFAKEQKRRFVRDQPKEYQRYRAKVYAQHNTQLGIARYGRMSDAELLKKARDYDKTAARENSWDLLAYMKQNYVKTSRAKPLLPGEKHYGRWVRDAPRDP
jgi:hypothetical protein